LFLDGRIAPRSGLASKHFIDTGAGVIDSDYRGQVKVLLFNHGEEEFKVKEGDRIAQLVLERVRAAGF
jgi:dUTP pyrophosphatase